MVCIWQFSWFSLHACFFYILLLCGIPLQCAFYIQKRNKKQRQNEKGGLPILMWVCLKQSMLKALRPALSRLSILVSVCSQKNVLWAETLNNILPAKTDENVQQECYYISTQQIAHSHRIYISNRSCNVDVAHLLFWNFFFLKFKFQFTFTISDRSKNNRKRSIDINFISRKYQRPYNFIYTSFFFFCIIIVWVDVCVPAFVCLFLFN